MGRSMSSGFGRDGFRPDHCHRFGPCRTRFSFQPWEHRTVRWRHGASVGTIPAIPSQWTIPGLRGRADQPSRLPPRATLSDTVRSLVWGVRCQAVSAETAFGLTTAIVSDLAGRVLASSLGSIALCAGGTVRVSHYSSHTFPMDDTRPPWSRRPTIPVAATRDAIGHCPEPRAQVARRKPSLDDQRGACHRARIIAPHPCIRSVHGGLTMMQSCASAAKLRGGGPILENGVNTMASFG